MRAILIVKQNGSVLNENVGKRHSRESRNPRFVWP